MFAGEAAVRPPAVLLHRDGLRALLHDGVSLLDVLLAGPQGGGSQLELQTIYLSIIITVSRLKAPTSTFTFV